MSAYAPPTVASTGCSTRPQTTPTTARRRPARRPPMLPCRGRRQPVEGGPAGSAAGCQALPAPRLARRLLPTQRRQPVEGGPPAAAAGRPHRQLPDLPAAADLSAADLDADRFLHSATRRWRMPAGRHRLPPRIASGSTCPPPTCPPPTCPPRPRRPPPMLRAPDRSVFGKIPTYLLDLPGARYISHRGGGCLCLSRQRPPGWSRTMALVQHPCPIFAGAWAQRKGAKMFSTDALFLRGWGHNKCSAMLHGRSIFAGPGRSKKRVAVLGAPNQIMHRRLNIRRVREICSAMLHGRRIKAHAR